MNSTSFFFLCLVIWTIGYFYVTNLTVSFEYIFKLFHKPYFQVYYNHTFCLFVSVSVQFLYFSLFLFPNSQTHKLQKQSQNNVYLLNVLGKKHTNLTIFTFYSFFVIFPKLRQAHATILFLFVFVFVSLSFCFFH